MKTRWLLVTAGFSDTLESAAYRLESQALQFQLFDTLVVTRKNLVQICPDFVENFKEYLYDNSPGYGFFAWKPAIISAVLNSRKQNYAGIVWVDAGCEMFFSNLTRIRLSKYLKIASNSGFWGFSLNTPESQYTKSDTFHFFKNISATDVSPQIQATWFILQGAMGQTIATNWESVALRDIKVLDQSISSNGEIEGFIQHRSDQSILSLTIKSLGLLPSSYIPRSGVNGYRSLFAALTHPIWTSRNRTTKSVVPEFFRKISHISTWVLKISESFKRTNKCKYRSISVTEI